MKQATGRAAATEVMAGATLLINDGSTTFHLVTYLKNMGPLTIYTNSLAMIAELGGSAGIALYILGGKYNSDLYSLQGSLTEQMLELLSIDLAFIGTDAIDDEGRCLVTTPEEANLTKAMLRSGRKKILLADHNKLGAKGNIVYGTLQDYDMWITTPGIGEEKLRDFRKQVEIVEAEL